MNRLHDPEFWRAQGSCENVVGRIPRLDLEETLNYYSVNYDPEASDLELCQKIHDLLLPGERFARRPAPPLRPVPRPPSQMMERGGPAGRFRLSEQLERMRSQRSTDVLAPPALRRQGFSRAIPQATRRSATESKEEVERRIRANMTPEELARLYPGGQLPTYRPPSVVSRAVEGPAEWTYQQRQPPRPREEPRVTSNVGMRSPSRVSSPRESAVRLTPEAVNPTQDLRPLNVAPRPMRLEGKELEEYQTRYSRPSLPPRPVSPRGRANLPVRSQQAPIVEEPHMSRGLPERYRGHIPPGRINMHPSQSLRQMPRYVTRSVAERLNRYPLERVDEGPLPENYNLEHEEFER